MAIQLPLVLTVEFGALYLSGALSFVWKYVGMAEVPAFGAGVSGLDRGPPRVSALPAGALQDLRIPISIILMNTLSWPSAACSASGCCAGPLWERELSQRRAARGRRQGAGRRCCWWAPGRPG